MSPLGWVLTIAYSALCVAFFAFLCAVIGGKERVDA